MIRKPFVAAVALFLAAVGCGGDGGGGKTGTETGTVTLKLIAFKPERLEVKAGEAVTWRNDDGTEHTVTSGQSVQEGGTVKATPDGTFDSGNLPSGKSFTFTLRSPGTYSYYCKLHPATMRGQIVVA